MAGRGSRFDGSGQTKPKPLIDVLGRPMLAWALDSIRDIPYRRLVFVALQEHEDDFHLSRLLPAIVGHEIELILLDDVTEGQLCTVLAAAELFNDEEDVLIGNADTLVQSELASDIANRPADCAGIISVANLLGDRWSFARTDETGRVVEVAEKQRISDHASTGLYYFSSGRQLVSIGNQMIADEERTRGEYYVIPVYQKLIAAGWRVDISKASAMWDMGTPAALETFRSQWPIIGMHAND